jgi:hypothetical protein
VTYVLPLPMWATYIAFGTLALGFFIGAAGLLIAIPHIVVGGGKTYGERAYRANQRHWDLYTKPEFKRPRMLIFLGFGIFGAAFAFMWFLILAFGQPVPNWPEASELNRNALIWRIDRHFT